MEGYLCEVARVGVEGQAASALRGSWGDTVSSSGFGLFALAKIVMHSKWLWSRVIRQKKPHESPIHALTQQACPWRHPPPQLRNLKRTFPASHDAALRKQQAQEVRVQNAPQVSEVALRRPIRAALHHHQPGIDCKHSPNQGQYEEGCPPARKLCKKSSRCEHCEE